MLVCMCVCGGGGWVYVRLSVHMPTGFLTYHCGQSLMDSNMSKTYPVTSPLEIKEQAHISVKPKVK